MGSRRQAREKALQLLFGAGFTGFEEVWAPDVIDYRLNQFVETFGVAKGSVEFMSWLVKGVLSNLAEIDRLIEEAATNWRVDRMNRVDRSIIRLAVFEVMKEEATPVRVVINEAIELAKAFSCQESSRFINGILDNICHKLRSSELSQVTAPDEVFQVPVDEPSTAESVKAD